MNGEVKADKIRPVTPELSGIPVRNPEADASALWRSQESRYRYVQIHASRWADENSPRRFGMANALGLFWWWACGSIFFRHGLCAWMTTLDLSKPQPALVATLWHSSANHHL